MSDRHTNDGSAGTMGLRGDLSSGEILEQLLHAQRICDIRNIVFMGQGEVSCRYLGLPFYIPKLMSQLIVLCLSRSYRSP